MNFLGAVVVYTDKQVPFLKNRKYLYEYTSCVGLYSDMSDSPNLT